MQFKESVAAGARADVVCVEELELDEDGLVRIARAELSQHTLVPAEGIELHADHGVIAMSGFVVDRDQRDEAVHAIEHVLGVRAVTSSIKVVALQVSSSTLHGAVEAALVRHASREADRLAYEVHGNTVTVSGEVASEAARHLVLGAVAGTRGVEHVIDRLRSIG